MGKIDKDKLLKEIKLKSDDVDVTWVCNFIKNFPEDPEIDFDALFDAWANMDMDWSRLKVHDQARSFRDFLKSKNLTQPQIDMDQLRHEVYSNMQLNKTSYIQAGCPSCGCSSFKIEDSMMCSACGNVFELTRKLELPIKRTWTLKKEYENAFKTFGFSFERNITLTVEPFGNLKEFYDQKEEPDYSKIPKGSIVVVSSNDNKIKSAEIVDRFESNHIYCYGGVSYELKYVKIRVVELAKE